MELGEGCDRPVLGGSGGRATQSRTFYAVDAGLAVGFAAITVTGVVISTWLDLTLASYAAWYAVHVAASVATLGLLVVKIGLHWRWIVSVARRSIFPAPALRLRRSGRAVAAQPVAAPQRAAASQVNRRDFIRLMAGVSAVALLAGANALGGTAGDEAEASASAASTSATSTTSTRSTSSSTGTSGSCSVRCGKRCSYPGHCRKYTDSNDNGRCDLGECLS